MSEGICKSNSIHSHSTSASSPSFRFPRVFLVRHGETEWSKSGKHTGVSDIPLTENGRNRIIKLAPNVVGRGRLIDPDLVCSIFVSPRQRALKTASLLFQSSSSAFPSFQIDDNVREWDYGAYEGLTSKEIRSSSSSSSSSSNVSNDKWDIWRDGCPKGESPDQIGKRADKVVEKIRKLHREFVESHKNQKAMSDRSQIKNGGDVVIVAHSHFLRVFLSRWCGLPVPMGRFWVLDAGSLSAAGYEHENLNEPVILNLNVQESIPPSQIKANI